MNGTSLPAFSPNNPLSRNVLITLLDAAMRTDEFRYARRLCTSWLANYPGDLEVNLVYARALHKEKSPQLQLQALPLVEEICELDPEYLDAQELLANLRQIAGTNDHLIAKACANVLSHGHLVNDIINGKTISWAKSLNEARLALSKVRAGDYQEIEKAEYYIHKALIENPNTPLSAIIHLRLIESKGSMPKLAVRNLAQIYHERWPSCLQFLLTLSNELMESGDSIRGVSLLHHAVSKDITGQVARRMWGSHHQYTSLWPSTLEFPDIGQNCPQSIPVPAAVASFLGWNQIPSIIRGDVDDQYRQVSPSATARKKNNQPISDPSIGGSSSLHDASTHNLSGSIPTVQTELERMAEELRRPHLSHEDGRFPIYVVFTTRGGLEAQYGTSAFKSFDETLKKLVNLMRRNKVNQEFWGSMLVYADDVTYTQPYQLQPAPYHDAGQLKLLISDLDGALEKRGERIGALLIVGGPEIVPFHKLPNPVEDADNDVPSDNPYATRDNNYYISDWQVGRVSGGTSADPSDLLKALNQIILRYDTRASKLAWYRRLIDYIQELFRRGVSKKLSSYGYTAAVWRRASLSVFRSIGNPDELLISPPVYSCENSITDPYNEDASTAQLNPSFCLVLPHSRLAYFNLHGVPDGSEWYGQCDPTQPETGPDFPVALRPQDIDKSGYTPQLVFTEACYGTNIGGKTVEDSICLKLLASGTQAVIGSTCISYGSLATPLTSADLLARVFWTLLQEGFTAGEALRRAKIHLTREMNNRQGFLDAEDQKTLISFALFGDPMAQPFKPRISPKIIPHLSDAAVPIPTVCEHSYAEEALIPVSLETIAHLKSIVAQYLPGMKDAQVTLSQEKQSCSKTCHHCSSGVPCVVSQMIAKNDPPLKSHRRVVTLSKNFERAKHIHKQYARLTLDEHGKIVKMVISH